MRWLGNFQLAIATALLVGFSGSVAAQDAVPPISAIEFENRSAESSSFASTELVGRDARLQLLVSATSPGDARTDFTHRVVYTAKPSGIVSVASDGLVTPIRDGSVTIVATTGELSAEVSLTVRDTQEDRRVSFPSQITPIFTKLNCNGGGCHGKAAGQNGFKLSLLGFEPRSDYDRLLKESRGRRISIASPDQSLLLQKAINASPHGGGQRMAKDSHEYRLLRRWISQGMGYGNGDEATVTEINVFPSQRRIAPGNVQQLAVIATYSDGSTEDVTRAALFESNDTEMADVTTGGQVKLQDMVGDVAVMARYQGHVDVFTAVVPRGNIEDRPQMQWPKPSNAIDTFVYKKLRSLGIPPSGPCDDATYFRRATLDISGRLPTVDQVQEFIASKDSDKRARLVDRLLDSDDYAALFANKWSAILRNKRTGGGLQFRNMAFHQWIADSLRENKPYDRFVRELVTASGSTASNPAVAWLNQVSDTNQRIEDTAQLFLGQRIQCARCHHHPYEKWSQKNYAQMSAFFSLVVKKGGGDPAESAFVSRIGAPTARHPKTGQPVQPAGLDSTDAKVAATDDARLHLAQWMTDIDNPFFAKSLVNRYWKHFMGRGIVEPEDDMRVTNPPSNPELLDAIAEAFVDSGFDLKALVRMICASNVYNASSNANDENLADRRSYSRFYPKRMTAEVLLDAVDQVTLSRTQFAGMPPGTRAIELPDSGFKAYFLTVFGQPDASTACECERSQEANLAQSLHLLNSDQMQKKLSADDGRSAQLAKDVRTDTLKIIELYLIALGREPRAEELSAAIDYVKSKENRQEAYEDLVWTLLNSKEFMFNH